MRKGPTGKLVTLLQRRSATAIQKKQDAEGVTISEISQGMVLGTLAMFLTGAALQSQPLFGLSLLLGMALGLSYLWARFCLRNLEITRKLSHKRAFFGEQIDMSQVFTNSKVLPLQWLAVEDEIPAALEILSVSTTLSPAARRQVIDTVVSLGWYERLTRHYTLRCTTRGEHDFGPISISSGDVFGLFRRAEKVDTPQTLLVYPRYVPVTRLGITARQPFGDAKAIQHLATDPLRLRGIREYAYGDNPRFIHWKATARRGDLQTKLFEPAATPQLFIFCNQDTFSHIWEGIDTPTLELTITVAASLANHALEEGYMVGLQVNSFAPSSDRQVKIQPSRDPGQLARILESLARINGWSGAAMEDLIRAERRHLPRAATIVVVTGIVTDDMLSVLIAIRRAGHPVTLVETAGSQRFEGKRVSGESMRLAGIHYFLVETLDESVDVERLAFSR